MKGESKLFAVIHAPGIAASGIPRHFSPHVESLDPHTVLLDISGMERLLGEPYSIAQAIRGQAGPQANVAIANSPNAAVCAARGYPGIVIIPPGEEAARLGGLPLDLLEMAPEILEVLHRWGLYAFRDLAALPGSGLVERFGAEGARLHQLAQGRDGVPLKPDAPPKVFSESMEPDDAIDLLEPLCFLISSSLHTLCKRLQSEGLAALAVTLNLVLADKTRHERTLRLPVPARDPLHFLKLMQLDLQSRPPAAPVTRITVSLEPASPRGLQSGLFVPPAPEPEKLELTLQRLILLVGEGNVGSPQTVDTHRPGAFRMGSALTMPASSVELPTTKLAFRLFRPALAAQVTPRDGPPEHVRAQAIQGSVSHCAGPWRTSGDWWTTTPWARDDFDIEISGGAVYRLYRDAMSGRWFLDGYYD